MPDPQCGITEKAGEQENERINGNDVVHDGFETARIPLSAHDADDGKAQTKHHRGGGEYVGGGVSLVHGLGFDCLAIIVSHS